MAMRRVLFLSLLALFAFVLVCTFSADDSSAEVCDNVRVYIQNSDGTYDETVVSGVQTVREAVQTAAAEQGKNMKLNITSTNVLSVDDVKNDSDHQWRIFQWLPPGKPGWGVQIFGPESDGKMSSGTTYCINFSTMQNVDGTIVYSPPTFKPQSTGYIFIRFANGFSPDNEHVQAVFTSEIRRDGFWVEGRGSDMGEVLADAINSNWPGELELSSGEIGGEVYSSWITSMFGLSDVKLGENTWSYWCQWTWSNHQWSYNSNTLGYYDPAVCRYVEIIYIISTPDPYADGGYIQDKGGPDPNPETDTIVCLKNRLTAEFRLEDGSLWREQELRYGERIDMTQIPDPSEDSKGFVGWGDTNRPLYADAVFTASFVPVNDDDVCVRYTDAEGNLIINEYLEPGSPATYSGVPTKNSTRQYDFVFAGWSEDLSNVTADITVSPVFDSELRSYDVDFYNYDRTFIETKPTKYGTAAEMPDEPARASTVSHKYVFRGWSLTPNNYVAVDLDNVTDVMSVYAYFEPTANDYTLTFKDGDNVVGEFAVKYGSPIGRNYPLDLFSGEYIAKMYRDSALTMEYDTTQIIIGDTTVYVSKVIGAYDSVRDTNGNVVGDRITVTYGASLASRIPVSEGRAVICDISQYPNGTVAVFDRSSLLCIQDAVGADTVVEIRVPRGAIAMGIGDLLTVLGDADELTFSVTNGPNNIKISTALKKINYTSFYRINLRVDNMVVMDLSEFGLTSEISLRLDLEEGMDSDVWNIASSGATTHYESTHSGHYVTFVTDLLQFYAVGSSDAIGVRQGIIVPYGEMQCQLDGSGILGHAKLISMTFDAMGEIVFVPSSHEGCTIRTVGAGALNGITNSTVAVIPVTVSSFSWDGWANAITDVYFTGNCPTFEGNVPDNVTVHYSTSKSGWSTSLGVPDLVFLTYDGSYKNEVFGFIYYRIGEGIVIHRYTYGAYVDIPEYIAVDGTAYPVNYIGDAAFMFSKDVSVITLYDLRFSVYRAETVELSPSVREIQNRAFYGSTFKTLSNSGYSEHIWDEAFRGCTNLSNVWFGNSLVFIGYSAFEGCSSASFARITIPDPVAVMGDRAFYGCVNVTTVSLGNGLDSVPAHCFEGCTRLSEVSISDSVKRVGNSAFCNCGNLLYVDLNKVVEVGDKAFYSGSGSSSMEFIILGSDIVSFGRDAFGNNTSLKEIEVNCMHFEGFELAFTNVDLSSVTFYAADNVIGSWSGYHTEYLVEPDPKNDTTLLHSVEIGLVIFFIVVGAISFQRKMKLRT